MQAQRTEWVDSIRYLRGLGRPRPRRYEHLLAGLGLVMLAVLTVVAAVQELG